MIKGDKYMKRSAVPSSRSGNNTYDIWKKKKDVLLEASVK